jgi:hypothetical protein
MAITSVASSVIFLPSAEAADVIESAAPSSRTVPSATPAVINSVSAQTGPHAIVATASDIKSSINGINGLIQAVEQTSYSGIPGITPEQIAQSQGLAAEHLQAAEGATIAFADQQGLQGISFNFLPINFHAPTGGSPSSSAFAAASQAAAGTPTSGAEGAAAAAPLSVTPPSSTELPAVSSQGPGSRQTSSLVTSSAAAAPSRSTADTALSVLRASDQNSGPDTVQTQATKQVYDIYA